MVAYNELLTLVRKDSLGRCQAVLNHFQNFLIEKKKEKKKVFCNLLINNIKKLSTAPPVLRRFLVRPNRLRRLAMEVEIKLRLPDSASLKSLSSVLSPFLLHTHRHRNLFFDGAASQLASRRAVLRLRYYGEGDTPSRCVVALKANAVLVDGVSRVEEDEEDLDLSIGLAVREDPCLIASDSVSRVLRRVREEFGGGEETYVCLGGFMNVRRVYNWEGLKLEVDETLFDFGTLYEIECESDQPQKAKDTIEALLRRNQIRFSYSKMNKFAIFRAGKLPPLPECD